MQYERGPKFLLDAEKLLFRKRIEMLFLVRYVVSKPSAKNTLGVSKS
jgi:hypothetical protein